MFLNLVGYMIPAYTKTIKRRLNQAPKYYYFDVSLPNYLLHRTNMQPGSNDFWHAFEHLIMQEIKAYLGYSGKDEHLPFWHTHSGYEVDAVLGDAQVAIEIKSTTEVQSRHLKGLKAFVEELESARPIIVSLDINPRRLSDVEILPTQIFLKELWAGNIY